MDDFHFPLNCYIGYELRILARVQNIRAERMQTFFNEHANGCIELSPELIKSEDFLHCYFAATKAVINTRRREKIRLLARLLVASTVDNNFVDIDEREEYLQILEEISYREFMILSILYEYERDYSQQAEGLERLRLFWNSFINVLNDKLHITEDDVIPCLIRLARTGCYELFMGKYFDVGEGEGQTTPRFSRLKNFVVDFSAN